jgi:sodium/hydrogen antiporter
MNEVTLIAVLSVLLAWTVLSEWLAVRNVSGPLVCMVGGLVLANASWGVGAVDLESSTVHLLAELTLALLLFSDASGVPLAAARHDLPITVRLLGIGLPLSIVLGAGLALLLFPDVPLALAGLLAASLAPTDAALSASIVSDERLPSPVRRVLNVESGLNDGIATPVVTFFIAATAADLGLSAHDYEDGMGAIVEIAIGVAVGAGIAGCGGLLVSFAHGRGWMQHGARRLAVLALALLSFLVAGEVGGNPFVAAFVGGLAFGAVVSSDARDSVELTELAGSLMSLVLWFIFGAGFLIPAFEEADVRVVAYALASLTVVRMVPVVLALIGAGLDRPTVAFVGWFGPRGLASVVFALLAFEELGDSDPRVDTVLNTIALTIVFSVVAHGITARPLSTRYVAATRHTG